MKRLKQQKIVSWKCNKNVTNVNPQQVEKKNRVFWRNGLSTMLFEDRILSIKWHEIADGKFTILAHPDGCFA